VNSFDNSLGRNHYEYGNFFDLDDKQPTKVSFVYMGKTNAYDNELGLFGTSKNYDDEIKLLNTMKDVHALTPAEYVVLQALRQATKQKPLDITTYTRFIGNGIKDGFLRGGDWDFGGGAGVLALNLGGAPSSTDTNIGFRVSRDITLDSLNLESKNITPLEIDFIPEVIKVDGHIYRLEDK